MKHHEAQPERQVSSDPVKLSHRTCSCTKNVIKPKNTSSMLNGTHEQRRNQLTPTIYFRNLCKPRSSSDKGWRHHKRSQQEGFGRQERLCPHRSTLGPARLLGHWDCATADQHSNTCIFCLHMSACSFLVLSLSSRPCHLGHQRNAARPCNNVN